MEYFLVSSERSDLLSKVWNRMSLVPNCSYSILHAFELVIDDRNPTAVLRCFEGKMFQKKGRNQAVFEWNESLSLMKGMKADMPASSSLPILQNFDWTLHAINPPVFSKVNNLFKIEVCRNANQKSRNFNNNFVRSLSVSRYTFLKKTGTTDAGSNSRTSDWMNQKNACLLWKPKKMKTFTFFAVVLVEIRRESFPQLALHVFHGRYCHRLVQKHAYLNRIISRKDFGNDRKT